MYVLVEGVDASGKSTLVELLSKFPGVITTKEPGGTQMGKEIRSLILTSQIPRSKGAELFLFLADRSDHYEQIVKPNRQTQIVISDRGYVSGISYAMAMGGVSYDDLARMNHLAIEGHLPEKIIMMKIDQDLLSRRLAGKKHDMVEARGIEYQMNVQKIMEMTVSKSGSDVLFIDSDLSREDILEAAVKFIGL